MSQDYAGAEIASKFTWTFPTLVCMFLFACAISYASEQSTIPAITYSASGFDTDGDGKPDADFVPIPNTNSASFSGVLGSLDGTLVLGEAPDVVDSDLDGIPDLDEGYQDDDGDGLPNYLDRDSDSDGHSDSDEGATDSDGDGIPNYLDRDSDNDQIADENESFLDEDGDGVPAINDSDEVPPTYSRVRLGSLQVSILPRDAVRDGARWRLRKLDDAGEDDGGPEVRTPWFSVPYQQNLLPGFYVVEFQNAATFETPEERTIRVVGDQTRSITVDYVPAELYDIGEIPPIDVEIGVTVVFFVRSDELGSNARLTLDGTERDSIVWNSETGRFSFTPTFADRVPFSLTFAAAAGKQTMESQVVPVRVLQELPSESDVLRFAAAPPPPHSRNYLTVSDVNNPPMPFNNMQNDDGSQENVETFTTTISGFNVRIGQAPNGDPNDINLYEKLGGAQGRSDLKELRIYADTVIISSPLKLHQTDVYIYARELRFEDLDDSPAQIVTTPLAPVLPMVSIDANNDLVPDNGETSGIDGLSGLQGGGVELVIEQFHAAPGTTARFVLTGGDGGPPGPGVNGRPGRTLDRGTFPCGCNNDWLGYEIVWIGETPEIYFCGNRDFPTNGEPAIPSGRPGGGGDGGNLFSTLDLTSFLETTGGFSGQRGELRTGGPAGLPRRTVWIDTNAVIDGNAICNWRYYDPNTHATRDTIDDVRTNDTIPGPDAPAPGADEPVGNSGRFEALGPGFSWIHPFVLHAALMRIKELYLFERIDETLLLLSEYRELVAAYGSGSSDMFPDPYRETSIGTADLEMAALQSRIGNNLDFYGNPPAWIPLLSFEVLFETFQNEIEPAIRIFYLSYWLSAIERGVIEETSGLETALEMVVDRTTQAVQDYGETEEGLINLTSEIAELEQRLENAEARKEAVSMRLERRAQLIAEDELKRPAWRQALGICSSIFSAVPLGQPALGTVGTGLGFFESERDLSTPGRIFQEAGSLTKTFRAGEFRKKQDQFKADFADINNNMSLSDAETLLGKLEVTGRQFEGAAGRISALRKEKSVAGERVEELLGKLQGNDTEFKDLAREAAELARATEEAAPKIASALKTLLDLQCAIGTGLDAQIDIESSLAQQGQKVNHAALQRTRELEGQARERLLYYAYLLAKAYQYRTLDEFDVDLFSLNDFVAQLVEFVNEENDGLVSPSEFGTLSAVYEQQLLEIAAQIASDTNVLASGDPDGIPFSLTAEQLQELNARGEVRVNPSEQPLTFGPRSDDIRLSEELFEPGSVQVWAEFASGVRPSSDARVRIEFEHSGQSELDSDGRIYRFDHFIGAGRSALDQDASLRVTRWDVLKTVANPDPKGDLEEPSPLGQGLALFLRTQLDGVQDTPTLPLNVYSPVSANADLVIRKRSATSPFRGRDFVITGFSARLLVRDIPRADIRRRLRVEVIGDITPTVFLSEADNSDRQDGVGDFRRFYTGFTQVSLTAEQQYGSFIFERWENGFGQTISNDPTLQVTLNEYNLDAFVRARYKNTYDEDGDGMSDSWERFFFDNLFQTPNGDSDGDGLSNLTEFRSLSDPTAEVSGFTDTDGDGLDDNWELLNFGAIDSPDADPDADPDGDGVTNIEEFERGSDPRSAVAATGDFDGDSIVEFDEVITVLDAFFGAQDLNQSERSNLGVPVLSEFDTVIHVLDNFFGTEN